MRKEHIVVSWVCNCAPCTMIYWWLDQRHAYIMCSRVGHQGLALFFIHFRITIIHKTYNLYQFYLYIPMLFMMNRWIMPVFHSQYCSVKNNFTKSFDRVVAGLGLMSVVSNFHNYIQNWDTSVFQRVCSSKAMVRCKSFALGILIVVMGF
jgi:hypothetical protein